MLRRSDHPVCAVSVASRHSLDGAASPPLRGGEYYATIITKHCTYAEAGRCARRKERIWRTARGIRSLGSFHGNMLTSAFGASIAASMATAYGCAGISSGRISTGVWHLLTKSRVTVQTKSAFVRYILVRHLSTIAIVMSGRRATSAGPQPVMLFW